MEPGPSDRKKPKPSNDFLKYSGLGLQLLGTIGIAVWLGYKLDLYFDLTFPAFLLSFVMISFGGSIYQLYRTISK